ncbi:MULTISPECIES: branched-chain amino acid ABC transporter permease [unclassified Streptomyces]|uniref:branched-chain amino acid ABC transporter permease n=1 Tax=unclassified Streptomyces TaxID=2593676 RepID=UPI0036EC821D
MTVVIHLHPRAARILTVTGLALTLLSPFLPWTQSTTYPGNLTLAGYPGGSQLVTLVTGLLAAYFAVAALGGDRTALLAPAGAVRALRAASLAALTTTLITVVAIAITLGGAINIEPGGFLAAAGAVLLAAGAHTLPDDAVPDRPTGRRGLPRAAEVALITAVFLAAMFILTYGITTESAQDFLAFLPAAGLGMRALVVSGLGRRLSEINRRNRIAVAAAGLAAALVFPFTQTGDQYTAIAANILVFATVALGLNIVVGLVGLLDLGYVAFLGTGAYTAALVSGSTFSTFHMEPLPFWAAALLSMAVSLVAGVVIGAPTLRLHGDYLAIVTLGFGEIFRITVNNLDGTSGPSLTNGPNGINSVPNISLFGFDFGRPHTVLGVEFGRFANYYVLLLAVTALVVFVYARAGDSRVGRAWIALREDEKAATAMGIEGFRYKLLAFGLGASLAGLAGSVMAHLQTNAVPDNYKFADTAPPNSAFLLAAVVLGGMGTISGPLVGAALLYLIPAKFEFFSKYQMLLFGLALILMMRFRPEGLVPDRKHQLEFHEEEPGHHPQATEATA